MEYQIVTFHQYSRKLYNKNVALLLSFKKYAHFLQTLIRAGTAENLII